MTSENETISSIEASAPAELANTTDIESLDAWRVLYLGRRGRLTAVLRGLAELPVEERRSMGAEANRLKARTVLAL